MIDEEIALFKARVLSDIAHHQIEIFHAPVYDNEDEETMAENDEIVVSILNVAEKHSNWQVSQSLTEICLAAQDSICCSRIRYRN